MSGTSAGAAKRRAEAAEKRALVSETASRTLARTEVLGRDLTRALDALAGTVEAWREDVRAGRVPTGDIAADASRAARAAAGLAEIDFAVQTSEFGVSPGDVASVLSDREFWLQVVRRKRDATGAETVATEPEAARELLAAGEPLPGPGGEPDWRETWHAVVRQHGAASWQVASASASTNARLGEGGLRTESEAPGGDSRTEKWFRLSVEAYWWLVATESRLAAETRDGAGSAGSPGTD